MAENHDLRNYTCEWIGERCGWHGVYSFYRSLRTASSGISSVYRLGEFFVLQFSDLPICIAEIQLAWEDTVKHDKLLSLRLYFRPEDTPDGNRPLYQYGEDELLASDENIIIRCHELISAERNIYDWPSNRSYQMHNGPNIVNDYDKNLVCINPSALQTVSTINSGDSMTASHHVCKRQVSVLSYAHYCRYRATRSRLCESYHKWKHKDLTCAIGDVSHDFQRIFFCRSKFSSPEVQLMKQNRQSLGLINYDLGSIVPVLKGRPRKKKRSDNSSFTDTVSFRETRQMVAKRHSDRKSLKPLNEETAFITSLFKFMRDRNTPIKHIPALGFKKINLWSLYRLTERLGGYEKVTAKRYWRKVYDGLGGSSGITSAATCTRKHYERRVMAFLFMHKID
ncbi:AT-rich interactive domain-containing protein 5B [Trichoplax sp. H2]|nr:AT-rich interactive domain-containing protein 5B [Trichoplax sp. H2]|eukprot:RDD38821.1 AT-rich interactive domain-containing protein 5B [Trichoplax sp. H2]